MSPLTDLDDDPERVFRRLPHARARWTLHMLWRRLRMPTRRRRWMRQNAAAIAPYVKPAEPRASGPAVAMGDFRGETGLSRAALYELERLRRECPEIEAIDVAGLEPGADLTAGPEIGTLYLLSPPDSYTSLLPVLGPARLARARRVGLWVWETPIFPEDWRFALSVVHEIWTPSGYSRAAIAAAAGEVPVLLRPHCVSRPPRILPFDRAAHGIPADAFMGLAIMDLCSCPARKNPWAHVAAWKAAFGADPARVLLLKLRLSRRTACVADELRRMIGDAGNIRILEHEFEAAGIAGLQAAADVYLSLHRAEGYGLNIRECLEAGVPVLATDFSANAEYGPAFANYHPLPWRPVPYRDWTGHYPDGRFTWAEVRIDAAAQALRDCAAKWEAGVAAGGSAGESAGVRGPVTLRAGGRA